MQSGRELNHSSQHPVSSCGQSPRLQKKTDSFSAQEYVISIMHEGQQLLPETFRQLTEMPKHAICLKLLS